MWYVTGGKKNVYIRIFLCGKEIAKTHNIAFLIQLCLEIDPVFQKLRRNEIAQFTLYAVESRYPGDFYMPTLEEVNRAIELADEVRDLVLSRMALKK